MLEELGFWSFKEAGEDSQSGSLPPTVDSWPADVA